MDDPAVTARLDQQDAAHLHLAELTVRYYRRLRKGGFTKGYAQALAGDFHARLLRTHKP